MNDTYYIATGAKGKLYTLRHSFLEPHWTIPNEYLERDWHIKSLGNDWDKAVEKAKAYMVDEGLKSPLKIPEKFSLGTITKSAVDYDIITFGKNNGKRISELAETETGRDYLAWWFFAGGFNTKNIKSADILAEIFDPNIVHFGKHSGKNVSELTKGEALYFLDNNLSDAEYYDNFRPPFEAVVGHTLAEIKATKKARWDFATYELGANEEYFRYETDEAEKAKEPKHNIFYIEAVNKISRSVAAYLMTDDRPISPKMARIFIDNMVDIELFEENYLVAKFEEMLIPVTSSEVYAADRIENFDESRTAFFGFGEYSVEMDAPVVGAEVKFSRAEFACGDFIGFKLVEATIEKITEAGNVMLRDADNKSIRISVKNIMRNGLYTKA